MNRRIVLRVLIVSAVLLTGGCTAAISTVDQWLMAAMDPGAFDPAATPPAPDYSDPAAWAALPETVDGADVALPELPAVDPTAAPADVFYVHPTTALGPAWNASTTDPVIQQATTRGGTLIQASAFNGCCAVYAPRYRQAHGHAFTNPDARGTQALEVAYGDVSRAFDAFLARTGARPFLIAAHSQGAELATRLVAERVAGTPLQERLVAAWIIGSTAREADFHGDLPVCSAPEQTGCVIAWNARGPGFEPNGLEFEADRPDTMDGRICVNPITWRADAAHAPAEDNAGALFFDTPAPRVKPAFADAQCADGTLLITELGDPERDVMSRILLWMMGPENYHPIEYQLFYVNIRENAAARVHAFLAR
ncbi:MAG: DUF3089 domain-containing protein [Alphaproteobacteria bacterium]|nr:DUF3089 domain-containing protein [Alphaproteobacteria bacterium]